MSEEIASLARAAAVTLVSAMTSDSWGAVKRRFSGLVGHEERMDAARAEIAAARGPDRGRAESDQVTAWTTRLRDLLEDKPGAADGLRSLLAELGGRTTVTSQQAAAGSQNVNVGGSMTGSQAGHVGGGITGNTGEVYVGVGTVDKRRRIFLVPFIFFFHVVKRVASAHPVATSVTTIVVVGGAAAGIAFGGSGPGITSGCVFGGQVQTCASSNPEVSKVLVSNGDCSTTKEAVTVNWGDGSPAQVVTTTGPRQAGVPKLLANHTYEKPGVYTINTGGVDITGSCPIGSETYTFHYS